MENDKPEKKQLHPLVKQQILYLMKQDKMGSKFRNIKFSNSSISTIPGDENWANKLLLSIPYAGSTLDWHLKFFKDDVMYAPDFYTNDDEPFFNILTRKLVEEKVTSWTNWDPRDPTALYRSIIEFVALYNQKEVKKLYKHPEIFSEYISLLKVGYQKEDIEVKVEPWSIKILIPLDIDFAILSKDDVVMNPDLKPKPVLLITILGSYPKYVNGKFHCVPKIDVKFSYTWNRQMPKFRPPMIEYISKVKKFLLDKLHTEMRKYVMRPAYLAYLLLAYPSNILEYDNLNHSKAAFIFETNGFHYILIIKIDANFPITKPTWILRSMYAFFRETPLTEIVLDYPYYERWDPQDMIKSAMDYIQKNVIPNFQKSNRVGFYA